MTTSTGNGLAGRSDTSAASLLGPFVEAPLSETLGGGPRVGAPNRCLASLASPTDTVDVFLLAPVGAGSSLASTSGAAGGGASVGWAGSEWKGVGFCESELRTHDSSMQMGCDSLGEARDRNDRGRLAHSWGFDGFVLQSIVCAAEYARMRWHRLIRPT